MLVLRGYYFDDELGLYYLQSRYYDPEIGRFISADSIEYINPENVNGLNLYAYCGNNPVMNVDPNGKFPILALILGITALVGLCLTIGGVASSVATSAIEEKSIGEILFNGLVGGLSAGLAFGFGRLIGRVVYQVDDFVFGTFWEMAKVDGANVVKGALTAFNSSWFKFLPGITPGTTRAILNFFGKKIGGLLND